MQITKTINEIKTGELNVSTEMTVDFGQKIIIIGAEFDNENFSCEVTFEEIIMGFTGTQIAAVNNFFNKAQRIAINNKIQPDIDLVDGDFTNGLSSPSIASNILSKLKKKKK